jgi:uncharacterized RDD family membrane protein YckC
VADKSIDSKDKSSHLQIPRPSPLASRGDRLLAVTVDSVIGLVTAIPVAIWTGEFQAALHGEAISSSAYLTDLLAGWGWFFLVNTHLLKKYGQTVGKRFLRIRIADHPSEAVPPFWRLVFRTVISSVPALFGIVGGLFSLADSLFIFTSDRRCIHDWIARTRVVKV